MPTIGSELKPRLKQSLSTHKILAATAARLYKCDGRRWTLIPNSTGALTLATTKNGILHLILISSSTWSTVLSQELYYDFRLVCDNATFYSFETEDGWMGINFVDADEAVEFTNVIDGRSPRQLGKSPRKRMGDADKVSVSGASLSSSKSGSTFSRAFSFIKSKVSSRDDSKAPTRKLADLSLADIGDPTDFCHSAHIGFDARTGTFDVHNVPDEWMAVFKSAGVTEKQLKNPETATFIASFVQEQVKQGRSAPPVPAKKKMVGARKAPPPPTNKVAAEPPANSKSPPVDPARNQLLASIRGSGGLGTLKKVESSPTKSLTPSSGNDDMSQLLVKALATRNRKLQADEDSDSEW